MAKDQAPISPDLLEMKQRLTEWRSTQPVRSPLPASFWKAILKLARQHGLYQTARTLPIDYGTLKRRLTGEPNRSQSAPPPSFVELITTPPTSAGCVIEMLRIETGGSVDWVQLLAAWRRRGA